MLYLRTIKQLSLCMCIISSFSLILCFIYMGWFYLNFDHDTNILKTEHYIQALHQVDVKMSWKERLVFSPKELLINLSRGNRFNSLFYRDSISTKSSTQITEKKIATRGVAYSGDHKTINKERALTSTSKVAKELGQRTKGMQPPIMPIVMIEKLSCTDFVADKNSTQNPVSSTNALKLQPFTQFHYPLEINFQELVNQHKQGVNKLSPINPYRFRFVINPERTCKDESLRMIYLVKSAPQNPQRRNVIRETWANSNTLKRFSFKRLFLIGLPHTDETQHNVSEESGVHGDILQIDFKDAYYNNTLKTTGGMKWVAENCREAAYAMFVDDDFYIDTYKIKTVISEVDKMNKTHVFMGNVLNVAPERDKKSKWYISEQDYPYDKYPPFVNAGSWIINKALLRDVNIAIPYVKHFKFDDVFVGIVAHKLKVEPIFIKNFRMRKVPYRSTEFAMTLTSHGYDNATELTRAWNCTVHREMKQSLPPYCITEKEVPFSNFSYPLEIDFQNLLSDIRNGSNGIEPINSYNYQFLINPLDTCSLGLHMIFLVKSSPQNIIRRHLIRETWGNRGLLEKLSFKVFFLIGNSNNQTNKEIGTESQRHKDILQIGFHDNYYNNTLKTTGGIKWAAVFCRNAKFVMFVDDDFLVNTYKIKKFVSTKEQENVTYAFMGNVVNGRPLRTEDNKWFISITKYPFSRYPPFVSAGSWVITRDLLLDMNDVIPYTKHFIFDDVFIAIVAHKLKVKPLHVPEFVMNKVFYGDIGFNSMMTSHDYLSNATELRRAWNCVVLSETGGTLPSYCFREVSFSEFRYPALTDFHKLLHDIRTGSNVIKPINVYRYPFVINPNSICKQTHVRLIFLVKSSAQNNLRRNVIRETWGSSSLLKKFSFKIVFILGFSKCKENNDIIDESYNYRDILLIRFHDNYYNNTFKTTGGIKWVAEHCSNAKFVMFVEDDFFVNTYKIKSFIEVKEKLNITYALMGNVVDGGPKRTKGDAWYISVKDYPFDKYPPFVSRGSWVITRDLLLDMHRVIPYTKHFIFDDVFIGIVAYKLNVKPIHVPEFYMYHFHYRENHFKDAMTSNEYASATEMKRAWSCIAAYQDALSIPSYCFTRAFEAEFKNYRKSFKNPKVRQ